jgi:dTDP-4-dehydrorhamnose 3,5-epimerase
VSRGFLWFWGEAEYLPPEYERAILWNDPALGIDWQLKGAEPLLSGKDKAGKWLVEAEVFG